MKTISHFILVIALVVLIQSCKPAGGEFAGTEYMPDMAHPITYEANVYDDYKLNTWDEQSVVSRKELSLHMYPVKGTVPRGYAGVYLAQGTEAQEAAYGIVRGDNSPRAVAAPVNGKVPYYYADTPEDRQRATAEIIDNPYPITEAGLAQGKELYNIYCGICHGEKGNGLGYLVRDPDPTTGDPGGKYPAAPANLVNDEFTAASNGRFYHAIMYGLNVMGAYKDKLSYEERWQVIHYIRSLQAAEKKLAYNESKNTLNPAFGTPGKLVKKAVPSVTLVSDATTPVPGPSGH